MKTLTGFSFAALALVCLSAAAQTQAPGLWEYTLKLQSSAQGSETEKERAERQKEMAAMPPEQRKAIEQMMAISSKEGSTFKGCVSKEDAAAQRVPQMADGNCTQQVLQRSGNTVKFKWQCTGPDPSSGEGTYTFAGDKAFSSKEVATTTMEGKPERMNVERSGRWLSADCGAIKPRAPAKP